MLVTGANRGLGRALVDEALRRGAKRVYAASRQPMVVADERVTALIVDVTDPAQIHEAVDAVDALDILINAAAVADDLSDRSAFEQHLAVNLYGTLDVTRGVPAVADAQRGAVVNIVSVGAVAAVAVLPAYSVSKAALLSVTQSLRALLAGQDVSVHAVMPGPIDTDMVRALDIPKTAPEDVARATLDGLERGEEEIFRDPLSQSLAEGWRAAWRRTSIARTPPWSSRGARRITRTLRSAGALTSALPRTDARCASGPAHDPNAVVGRTPPYAKDAAAPPRL